MCHIGEQSLIKRMGRFSEGAQIKGPSGGTEKQATGLENRSGGGGQQQQEPLTEASDGWPLLAGARRAFPNTAPKKKIIITWSR